MFLIKKSYQDIDTSLQSAVVTKVKGVAYTNTTMLGERLWDVADFVIPSQVRSLPGSWASEVGRVTEEVPRQLHQLFLLLRRNPV